MGKRVLFLTMMILLSFLGSCWLCKCPEVVYPYIDYSSVSFWAVDPTLNVSNPELLLTFSGSDFMFVSENKSAPNTNGMLMACSCNSDGMNGDKYPVESVEIYTDSLFDSQHPAGSSIADLVDFGYLQYDYAAQQYNQFVATNYPSQQSPITLSESEHAIRMNSLPDDLMGTYTFTIVVTKSNQEQISATSQNISWQ